MTQRLIPIVLVTVEILQLLVDKVVDAPIMQVVQVVKIPVVAQRLFPMVLQTIEIPKFVFDKVIDVPVVQVVLAVSVVVNYRCARYRLCRFPWMPQLQFLHDCGRRCDTQR